jgi:ADP-ribosylation factor protein 6
MTPQEVTDKLNLTGVKDTIWYVVPSCATTGEGLLEGLVRPLFPSSPNRANPLQAWLSNNIKTPPAGTVKT